VIKLLESQFLFEDKFVLCFVCRHKEEDGKQPEYTIFTLSTIIDVVRAHVEDG
jgi:hypothetical protein